MNNDRFNAFNSYTSQEFIATPEAKAINLAQQEVQAVRAALQTDDLKGNVANGALKNVLMDIGNQVDTYIAQVQARIGATQKNKLLLNQQLGTANQSNADLNSLLTMLPSSDPVVQSTQELSDVVNGYQENYILFSEGTEELQYRVSQIDSLANVLTQQKTTLTELRSEINDIILTIDSINGV